MAWIRYGTDGGYYGTVRDLECLYADIMKQLEDVASLCSNGHTKGVFMYVDPAGAISTCSKTTVKVSGHCHIYSGTKYLRTEKIDPSKATKTYDTCGTKKKCWLAENWYLVGECSVSGKSMLPGGFAMFSCGFNITSFGLGIPYLDKLKVIKFPAPLKLKPGEKADCNVKAEAWVEVWITH